MPDESTNDWPRGLLDHHEAVAGTVHVVRDDLLRIAAAPGARAVDGKAAVSLPVRGADGSVRAVVGLAWLDERELTDGELAKLDGDAESLPASEVSVPRPRRSDD